MGKVTAADGTFILETRRLWRIRHELKPMRWRDMGDGWGHYVEDNVAYSAFDIEQRRVYGLPPHGMWELFIGIFDECGCPVENAPYILHRSFA
jgi:hypothetical protein